MIGWFSKIDLLLEMKRAKDSIQLTFVAVSRVLYQYMGKRRELGLCYDGYTTLF